MQHHIPCEKYELGDLVQVVDIGDGTLTSPWTETMTVGIYLGTDELKMFPYNSIDDLSRISPQQQKWHIVWVRGRRRMVSHDGEIKLLAKAKIQRPVYLEHVVPPTDQLEYED
jgi:hypothetical protein